MALLYVNRLRNVMCEIYTIINEMSPEYLRQLHVANLKEIPYETRSVVPLDQPKIRTVLFGQRSIRYEGARLWNSLPNHFKMTYIRLKILDDVYLHGITLLVTVKHVFYVV